MKLGPLTKEHMEPVRKWRNLDLTPYRTPYFLTQEMQDNFYDKVICNRNAEHRFFAVLDAVTLVAMVGLVNISLENRNAEISIVVDPSMRGHGIGKEALKLLLEHGFTVMNLDHIYGECYTCSPSFGWWSHVIEKCNCPHSMLHQRKFWHGTYYDSIYFTFDRWRNYDYL